MKMVANGDMDVEMFEIMMKHMKSAEKEAEEVLAARKKNAEIVQEEDSSDEEDERVVAEPHRRNDGVQSDGEILRSNKYGASGSSARYSDSEITKIKAPVIKRVSGRPRTKRLIAGSESSKKKWKKKKNKENATSVSAAGKGLAGVDAQGDVNVAVLENNEAFAARGENINPTFEVHNEDGICTGKL